MKQVLTRFTLVANVVKAANERTINNGLAGYLKNEKSFASEQYFKKVDAMSYGLTTSDVESESGIKYRGRNRSHAFIK